MSSGRSGNPRGVRELQGMSGNYKVGPEATRLHRQTRELWSDVLLTETQVKVGSAISETACLYSGDADVNETTQQLSPAVSENRAVLVNFVFVADSKTAVSLAFLHQS